MRQDVYRVAFDEAHSELLDISTRFEELRRRKESLESVIAALGPMLAGTQAAPAQEALAEATTAAPQAAVGPADYSFNHVPAPLPEGDETTADPFQRRVRNALKFSSNNNGHEHRGLQPAV